MEEMKKIKQDAQEDVHASREDEPEALRSLCSF